MMTEFLGKIRAKWFTFIALPLALAFFAPIAAPCYAQSSNLSYITRHVLRQLAYSDSFTFHGVVIISDSLLRADTTLFAFDCDTSAYADDAGHADEADTAVYADDAGHADEADTAVYADDAGHADEADSATYAEHAAEADTADHATHATVSDSADYAYSISPDSLHYLIPDSIEVGSSNTIHYIKFGAFAWGHDSTSHVFAVAGIDTSTRVMVTVGEAVTALTAPLHVVCVAGSLKVYCADADTAALATKKVNWFAIR